MIVSHPIGKALEIICARPEIRPVEFAAAMWPSAPGWRKLYKSGNHGSARGTGMSLAAGGFLGRLRRSGLIDFKNRITTKGSTALAVYRGAKAKALGGKR